MIVWQILRIAAVIVLLGVAAALSTPKGCLPLVLRGVQRMLRRDAGLPARPVEVVPVSHARRAVAFLLVILAVVLCVVRT